MTGLTAMQEAALALVYKGLIIQPAHRPDHPSGGKHPIASGWQNAEAMDEAGTLATWGGTNPPNISVLTGARPGIFVVDIDGPEGSASMTKLVKGKPQIPATFTVATPSGGWHMYFRQPAGVHIPTNKSRLAPGIDLRGDGGQVIGPGSRARLKDGSGVGEYAVSWDGKIAEAPPWLLEACVATAAQAKPEHVENSIEFTAMSAEMQEAARTYVQRAVEGVRAELMATRDWPEGHSDDFGRGWEKTQADAALRLASFAVTSWAPLSMEDAHDAFVTAAPVDARWTSADVEKKWASQVPRARPIVMPATLGQQRGSIFEDPPAQAPGAVSWGKHSWDDIGNAERLYVYAGSRLRWVPDSVKWARYERGAWHMEADAGEREAIDLFNRLFQLEGGLYDNASKDKEGKTERTKFSAWVKTQRYAARAQAAARTLRYSGRLNATTRDFDTHPMLLNVANGVVDLTTGGLLPHDPNYLFRQQSAATYNPQAKCPLWTRFLSEMQPDPEMRAYLRRVVGYTITGRADEQVFFMHHGVTDNGKSLFLDVLEAALGSYAQTVPPTTLLAKRQEQHPADVARMEGKRMLQLSETAEGARLDEALVKRLSGNDTITARGMAQEFREFKMMGKVHLITNHLPHINHDPATMRRLRLVHWPVRIPEERKDKTLGARIISTELAGVLAWAVQGCLEWQQVGLAPPLAAAVDTEEYIVAEDQLGQFLELRTRRNEEGRTTNEQIWNSYALWCDLMRIKPMSAGSLFKQLGRRGIGSWRSATARGWRVDLVLPPNPAMLTGLVDSDRNES